MTPFATIFLLIILLFQCQAFAVDLDQCVRLREETKKGFGEPESVRQPLYKDHVWTEIWTYNGAQRFVFHWGTNQEEPCHRSVDYLHPDGSLRSYQHEPDGFRDLKWGIDISSIKGMSFMTKTDEGTKLYQRKNDKLYIGEAKLTSIGYGFWKGKLCNAIALFKGQRNWEIIKGSLFEKFGTERTQYRDGYYIWQGEKTVIMVQYNDISNEGSMTMYSPKIREDIEASLRKAIKHGAETGF